MLRNCMRTAKTVYLSGVISKVFSEDGEIKVEAKDIHPPILTVTASQGFVDENSPVGTLVMDTNNNPITFAVSDKDLDSVILKYNSEIRFDKTVIAMHCRSQKSSDPSICTNSLHLSLRRILKISSW